MLISPIFRFSGLLCCFLLQARDCSGALWIHNQRIPGDHGDVVTPTYHHVDDHNGEYHSGEYHNGGTNNGDQNARMLRTLNGARNSKKIREKGLRERRRERSLRRRGKVQLLGREGRAGPTKRPARGGEEGVDTFHFVNNNFQIFSDFFRFFQIGGFRFFWAEPKKI